jgi:hypothetical protein
LSASCASAHRDHAREERGHGRRGEPEGGRPLQNLAAGKSPASFVLDEPVDELVVHHCLLLAMLVVRSAGFYLDR